MPHHLAVVAKNQMGLLLIVLNTNLFVINFQQLPVSIGQAGFMDQYRQQLPNLETAFVGSGLHYIQEDQPQKIGQAIAQWMDRCGL